MLVQELNYVYVMGEYKSLSNLDVYRNGILVSGLNVFGANYPESYEQILREVSKQSR